MKLFRSTFLLFFLLFLGCKDNNKTIPADKNNLESPTTLNNEASSDLHTVVVNEIIPTSNYLYLKVNEGDREFWIATKTIDAKIGETYFYLGGILKTNFESKELNRVFNELYLIGNLVSSNHGNTAQLKNNSDYSNLHGSDVQKEVVTPQTKKIVQHQGSIKIVELIKNKKKYEGKTVQIDAKCTKINSGIMNRNWIHLKDGSKDDFDLVMTSEALIQVGSVVTIKAVVALNKDFGAGYKYDLILEQGVLVD